jgi:hypothetical protein
MVKIWDEMLVVMMVVGKRADQMAEKRVVL